MKTSKIIAILIWAGAFIQLALLALKPPPGFVPMSHAEMHVSPEQQALIFLTPITFFGFVAFIVSRDPWEHSVLRRFVDKSFGTGAFSDFTMSLKPLLFMSCYSFGMALTLICSGVPYDFFAVDFFAGCGVAFFLMRIILKSRGILMEAGAIPASQTESSPLSSLRKIKPTKKTALLTGVWTVYGMVGTEGLASYLHLSEDARMWASFAGILVFFMIPVSIFVFGYQHQPDGKGKGIFAEGMKRAGSAASRMGFWMLGGFLAMLSIPLIAGIASLVVKK